MDIAEQISRLSLQEPDPIEELANTILKMTIEEPDVTSNNIPRTPAGVPDMKAPNAFIGITPRTEVLLDKIAESQYQDLGRTDELVNSRCHEVLTRLNSLASPDRIVDQDVLQFLEEEEAWLRTTLAKVKRFAAANQPVVLLKKALVERLEVIIDAVDCYKLILSRRAAGNLQDEPSLYDAGHCYQKDLGLTHHATLLACLNVLVLNLFGHVTHRWCNFTLKMLHTILQEAYSGDGRKLTPREIKILDNFPHDLRSVRNAFDIEAKTVTYAACPECNCTYAPSMDGDVAIYPSHCSWREFPASQPCAESLMDSNIVAGQSMRYPKRPFVVQDFDAFVATLLSRPGVEEALDQGTVLLDQEELDDIKDGTGVQKLRGPDGQPFLDSLQRSELRLVWSLSVDWFNPHSNKIAGKHVSTGSIAMACLNLPPSLRYKSEFMYLNAVMPVEPSLDQSNHYLKPIVDQLERSYRTGVKYNKTYKHPEGRQTRSAIAVLVNDLPGGKKVAQMAGHHSKSHFCSLCTLHKDRINEVDPECWVSRDLDTLRRAAYEWKNATSKAERDAVFAKFGVRWSELWRLSYFNPIRMLIIDGMHNLFEGLVQFHCRYVLGINESEAGSDDIIATTKEIGEAKLLLGSAVSSASAKGRIKMHVLKALCRERNLLFEQPGLRLTKKHMFNLLQTSQAGTNVPLDAGAMRTAEVANATSCEDIVGSEYIDEVEPGYKYSVGDDGVTQEELGFLRAALKSTVRPTWQRGPPMNFGCAAHGKLKADQWRSAIEFDVPITLAQLWSYSDGEVLIDGKKGRHRLVMESTVLLATSVQWGTSNKTSQTHANRYTQLMVAYLKSILHLYPSFKLRPNHHGALHIGPFLLEYGPMRGWWMYPFERIIGILQKTNTNSKLGQLERTMLESFCAAANLKALLLRMSNLPAVNQCARQVDNISELFSPDKNFPEAVADLDHKNNTRERRAEQLHPRIYAALHSKEDEWKSLIQGWATPKEAIRHRRKTFGGFEFATYTESHSLGSVFFKPDDSEISIPGRIRDIFAVDTPGPDGISREEYFLVINRHCGQRQSIPCTPDILSVFEEFGAYLWSSDLSEELDIVSFQHTLCHSIGRPWSDGVVVLKPMNRSFGTSDLM